jgi:glycosyltransferase involved in cell wall biosynthesis
LKDKLPFSLKLALKRQRARLKAIGKPSQETFSDYQKRTKKFFDRSFASSVVVFDDLIPTPDLDAGSKRMLLVLHILARHFHTVFVYQRQNANPRYEQALWDEGVETVDLIYYKQLLRQHNFKVAIVSRPEMAQVLFRPLRRIAPKLKIVFDTVDAHYRRLELEYQVTGDPDVLDRAKLYRKIELDLVRESDILWCTSPADEASMIEEMPDKPVAIIPTIHPLHDRGLKFDERSGLLFVGSFNHRPNSDGVEFFVEQVLPLIRRELPEVSFDVVGNNAPNKIQEYASEVVRIHGYVPDLEPLLYSRRVFVAPLRFGAGVKGKIGDALSYGLPVVTTDVGAEGMGFESGKQILIGNTPEEFAKAVITVYRNEQLWQSLSDNGYTHIANYFSPEAVETAILRSLA